MLLEKLIEYADSLEDLAPPLYSFKWVRYVIDLDLQGNLLSPEPIDLAGTERRNRRGQRRPVPHTTRSVNVNPLLLADHAEYTLGLAKEGGKPERVRQCHDAYMALLAKCAAETGEPAVAAVHRFLSGDPQAALRLDEQFDPGANIIFRIDGRFVHRLPAVQRFWARELAPAPAGGGEATMECIVCGEQKPALLSLKGKIKGVPGGQSVGTALISANKIAFESYGLERAQVAPICIECGDLFTKALNQLLGDDASSIRFQNLALAYWTGAPMENNFATWLQDPDPDAVGDLLNAARSGKWNPAVDPTSFYAVALSGSGGRAVVRDWIDTTVGAVKGNLAVWFQGQQIVDTWGEAAGPLNVFSLAAATVRDLKDVLPATYQSLIRAAMTGTPLPWRLLQQAVGRNHAERNVTRPRAALIKLVLISREQIKEFEMVQLQSDHPEAAYHCGRLLAVLETIQRGALGDINASVVDRFYGTASTAPASVFGRLLRGAQPHLSKLRRDRPGAGRALQERLEDVLAALPAFPTTLNLKEQGFFALGYYHQRAHDRAQARAFAARRKAGADS